MRRLSPVAGSWVKCYWPSWWPLADTSPRPCTRHSSRRAAAVPSFPAQHQPRFSTRPLPPTSSPSAASLPTPPSVSSPGLSCVKADMSWAGRPTSGARAHQEKHDARRYVQCSPRAHSASPPAPPPSRRPPFQEPHSDPQHPAHQPAARERSLIPWTPVFPFTPPVSCLILCCRASDENRRSPLATWPLLTSSPTSFSCR